jgi:hypothetical protein
MLSLLDSRQQCSTGPTAGSLGATVAAADLGNVYAIEVWVAVNSAPHLTTTPLVLSGGAVLANRTVPTGPQPSPDIKPPAGTLGLGLGC